MIGPYYTLYAFRMSLEERLRGISGQQVHRGDVR
jgi:hypothetical protein